MHIITLDSLILSQDIQYYHDLEVKTTFNFHVWKQIIDSGQHDTIISAVAFITAWLANVTLSHMYVSMFWIDIYRYDRVMLNMNHRLCQADFSGFVP